MKMVRELFGVYQKSKEITVAELAEQVNKMFSWDENYLGCEVMHPGESFNYPDNEVDYWYVVKLLWVDAPDSVVNAVKMIVGDKV